MRGLAHAPRDGTKAVGESEDSSSTLSKAVSLSDFSSKAGAFAISKISSGDDASTTAVRSLGIDEATERRFPMAN